MSANVNGLSPPGSSQYDSNTMFVGDGTWDASRNTFLLPNLVGLNFDTMRYNGMGNRFRELPEYYTLVLGHGILAFIVFGVLLPSALFIAKYMHQDRQLALKLHINLQIMNILLLTVVIILGFIAVGPPRSLTNPHHGIGLALYVCVLAQFLYGAWAHRREKKRTQVPLKEPKKFWLHKLFGRAIALLGFVQIALGLTLYGSPKYLFILYALVGAFLVTSYLILDYRHKGVVGTGRQPDFYSDYGSYVSGTQTDLTQSQPPRREDQGRASHWLRNTAIAGGAFAAYDRWQRKRQQKRDGRYEDQSDYMSQSQGPSSQPGAPPVGTGAPSQPGYIYGSGPPPNAAPSYPPGQAYLSDPNYSSGANYLPAQSYQQHQNYPPGSNYPPGPNYSSAQNYSPETPQRPGHGSRSGTAAGRRGDSRLSPESWEEDEKNEAPRHEHNWRERILGAGAGIAAFESVRGFFGRRKQREPDSNVQNERYHRPGSQGAVSHTDVSRVEQGQAPLSPHNDPTRSGTTGVGAITPAGRRAGDTSAAYTPGQDGIGGRRPNHDVTPTRVPGRARPRQSVESVTDEYTSRVGDDGQQLHDGASSRHGGRTLRDSIAMFGAIRGIQEWNRSRKERREMQRSERLQYHETDEEQFDRQRLGRYPTQADAQRPSGSETVMTGVSQAYPLGTRHDLGGSNPELSRTNFSSRPNVNVPPLPLTAGQIPSLDGRPSNPLSTSRQNLLDQGYHIPPPPAGPPPGNDGLPGPPPGLPPEPGSLRMPQGAVHPDPARLYSRDDLQTAQQDAQVMDQSTIAGAAAAAGIAASAATRGNYQSPSRYRQGREGSRTRFTDPPSTTFGEASQQASQPGAEPMNSPPLSVKMKLHSDGRHVTLRRLNDNESAAEGQARRPEHRPRRRRTSSVSSGKESENQARPGNSRFRRAGNGGMRPSSTQPIANVPPPPALSSSALGRPSSELHLPPPVPPAHTSPQALSPPSVGAGTAGSPPAQRVAGSGFSPPYDSPGEAAAGTDLSAFAADNRKRRRAERAREQQEQRVQPEW